MLKLICKKTGKEVRAFSVLIENNSYRRDYINIRERTVMEFEREYFSGKITGIVYNVKFGKKYKEMVYKIENDEKEGSFIKKLLNENIKFYITDDMIDQSKKYGPFLIVYKKTIPAVNSI